MKKHEINNITVEYVADESAKEKFIAYVVDYLLKNNTLMEDGDFQE